MEAPGQQSGHSVRHVRFFHWLADGKDHFKNFFIFIFYFRDDISNEINFGTTMEIDLNYRDQKYIFAIKIFSLSINTNLTLCDP